MSNCSLMEFYCRNLFDLINLNSRRIMITNKKETMGKFDLIISEIIDKIPKIIHKILDQKRHTHNVNVENIRKTESEKENAHLKTTSVVIV